MKKSLTLLGLTAAIVLESSACFAQVDAETSLQLNNQSKVATKYTIDANKQVYKNLDFEDKDELANASRGLIASPKLLEIRDKDDKLGAKPVKALTSTQGNHTCGTARPQGFAQPPFLCYTHLKRAFPAQNQEMLF